MKKVKDLPLPILRGGLERRYRECLGLEPSLGLVIALHGYIRYINEHPIIDYLFVEKIQKGARELLDQVKKAEEESVNELKKLHAELVKIVKENGIDNQKITHSLSECEAHLTGKYLSLRRKVDSALTEIIDVVEAFIADPKYNTLISHLVILPQPNQSGLKFGRIKLSPALQTYDQLKKQFENQQEIGAWGAFEIIARSYQGIESYAYTPPNNQENQAVFSDSKFIASAVKALVDEESGLNYRKPDHSAGPLFFRDYSKEVLSRLHLALFDELDKYEQDKALPEKTHERLGTAEITKFSGERDGPQVVVKNGHGYFKFNKKHKPIEIGKAKNQPYKLLEVLVEAIEAWKQVDIAFERIWSKKYDKNKELNGLDARNFKVQKIKEVFKELQTKKELQGGRISLEFSADNHRCVRLLVNSPVEKFY